METPQKNEALEKALAEYRKGPYNVLIPSDTIQQLSAFHKPILEVVRISSDPKDKEVYDVAGTGDFALHATALNKIAYAAGIVWDARGSGRTDNGSDPNQVSYKSQAAVRKEDGTYMLMHAEYLLDLAVIEEEIREQKRKKAEKEGKPFDEASVKKEMLQKRKFRLQLAQTGAMDRVIRKILGLKSTYKKEELQKPFVVPKICFSPDVSDPETRRILLQQGMEATNALFGPPSMRIPADRNAIPEKYEGSIDITPEPIKDLPPLKMTEKPKEIPWEQMDEAGQVRTLEMLMKKKAYTTTRLQKPVSEFSAKHRQQFKDALDAMKDAEPEQESLPFE